MLPATEESPMSLLRPARPCFASLALVLVLAVGAAGDPVPHSPSVAPPFPAAKAKYWIGPPQTWERLRGHVVLLDVWRYACTSCRATVPWVKDVRQRYSGRGLVLVGVHSPAFTFEHERDKVEAEVRRHGLDYSHLLDDDSTYMKALGAEGWPSMYLVDRCGRVRETQFGEVAVKDDPDAARLEAAIEVLLAEPAGPCDAAAVETRR
jgi:thiol-disulfide isomerase/thioredoxin